MYIQEALSRDIINVSNLAEFLKEDVEKEVKHTVTKGSIIQAIRRYREEYEKKFNIHKFNYFRDKLVVDNICYFIIKENATILPKISDLYKRIDFKTGSVLNIIQGNYEVGIITNERHKEKVMKLINDDSQVKIYDNLVSISLIYKKDVLETPGVLYNVFRYLAWNNINVLDIVFTPAELSIIIREKDSSKCQEVVNKLVKNKH